MADPVSDRRPLWLTPQLEEDLYVRWRELMVATHRRGGMLVAHPKWRGLYEDFIERLAEDEQWLNAMVLLVTPHPTMMFRMEIPEDDLYAWTSDGKIETPTEFFGRTGFGRLNWSAPKEEGIMPWSEHKFKGTPKPLTPDSGDEVEDLVV